MSENEDYTIVSAENLQGGLFVERINDAIQECLANVYDPNVEPDKPREIQATIKMVPHKKDPGKLGVMISVKTKLAHPTPSETIIHAGTKDGEYVAYEQNIDQAPLPFDGKKPAQIIEMEDAHGRSSS